MTKQDRQKLYKYWLDSANEDWKVFLKLKRAKAFSHSLFFLHLTLEKQLKALIVKRTGNHAPFSHNLVHLIGRLDIPVTESLLNTLELINKFNLETRYPDEKLTIYKQANLKVVQHWEKVTKDIIKWLETPD